MGSRGPRTFALFGTTILLSGWGDTLHTVYTTTSALIDNTAIKSPRGESWAYNIQRSFRQYYERHNTV